MGGARRLGSLQKNRFSSNFALNETRLPMRFGGSNRCIRVEEVFHYQFEHDLVSQKSWKWVIHHRFRTYLTNSAQL